MATTSCYQPYLCRSCPAQSNATLAEDKLSLKSPQSSVSVSLKSQFLSFISSWNTYSTPWFPSQRPKLTRWKQGLASPHHFPELLVFLPGCQLTSEYGSPPCFTPTAARVNPFLTLQVLKSGEMYNYFFNKKHFLAFILAKENLEITSECRLPNQAAAVKKQVHISVSWLFYSASLFVKTWLMIFWTLPRPAFLTVSSEKFWWFTARKERTQACDAEPFSAVSKPGLLCVSAEPCRMDMACTSPVPPVLVQASPLPQGLHGCKSKAQSCSSKESMRIFAFGIFMETGSCPKHIPRE